VNVPWLALGVLAFIVAFVIPFGFDDGVVRDLWLQIVVVVLIS
jgi:hypothetical protein